MRKVIFLIIFAVLLTASGLTICFGALYMIKANNISLNTDRYVTNTYTADGKFDDIRIDAETENIVFKKSQDGICSVVCYENENKPHDVTVKGNTLEIEENDQIDMRTMFSFSTETQEITVYLPDNSYDNLSVETDTGTVTVPDSFTFDDIEIKTNTGSVECGAELKGDIKIRSDTGRARINKAEAAGKFDIKIENGNIELDDCTASVFDLETDTGAVDLTGCKAGEIRVESSTGSISLTGSDADKLSIRTDTGNVTGSLLSGKEFVTKTDTGKISVPADGNGGKCEITTMSGNIKITVE